MNLSLRLRLGIWYGLVLLVVLAGFGFTAFQSAWQDQLQRVDRELNAQLDLALKADGDPVGPPGRGSGPPTKNDPFVMGIRTVIGENISEISRRNRAAGSQYYVAFLDDDGTLFARTDNAPAMIPAPSSPERRRPTAELIPNTIVTTQWRTRDRWREAYRTLPLGDSVLAGVSLESERTEMGKRALLFALAGVGLLVCGIAGGWWLTGKALRPIDEICRSAAVIAAGDLKERIRLEGASSELGELAKVLNTTFARLEGAFTRQARFTSDASHELRTPIAVIMSKTQTALLRERSATEYQEALRVCQRAANRMRELTEALLLLSRSEGEDKGNDRSSLDLAIVGREVASSLAVLVEEKDLDLQLQLDSVSVLANKGQISQVLTNLLNNAIKFTKQGGKIRLHVMPQGERALLEVQDTGQGIAAADLPHIFDRFYRGDQSRTGSGNYGLGLAIAKAIVESHRGEISVVSLEGEGSRFTVLLPRETHIC
jgi:two-component system OmpR family sensor kinase